ncbi:hypothetical protein Tco_0363268 [Tanacetum coccineum]
MILESVEHGPLIWPTVEENSVIRTKKYVELSAAEKIQADCDIKATNIILQGLPADIYSLVNHDRVAKDLWERVQLLMQCTSLTKQERECKLYNAFDKFTHIKGESLHMYYLRFTQLINDMNIYKMKNGSTIQVITKSLTVFHLNGNILISLMDSIEKAIAERGLYKRVHYSRVNERTMQTHEGMLSKDAPEIDNNVARVSHDKDNMTKVQSSNNEMFENILKKTKNALEMFEKTKTDHKMLKEENILLKKEIKEYKERVQDFNEKQYFTKLEQEKDELQDQVLKIKNATDSVKKAFKQDEDKYVNNIIQLEAKHKDLENIVSIACHPKLYDAEVLGLHYMKPDVHDTKEILNNAEDNPSTSNVSSESSKEKSDLPIPEMPKENTQRRLISDNQNELREFYKTDVILMSVSLSKSSKELQQELTEESYVELKNKKEIERFSKELKDSDKFCNDVVEVKEKLSKQIIQLEKDFAELEAQSIAFKIALQHKNQENKSLKTLQKENENFMASLQIENAHLKQTYKDLFYFELETESGEKKNLFESETCVFQIKIVKLENTLAKQTKENSDLLMKIGNLDNAFADEVKRATMGKLTAFDKENCDFGSKVTDVGVVKTSRRSFTTP